jgi:hypothetical protein
MSEKPTNSFSLEKIFEKYGIKLISDWDGTQRDIVDIIEDMYLRLDSRSIIKLFNEIGEEERFGNNIFQEARDKWK